MDEFTTRKMREDDIGLVATFERDIAVISFGDEAVTDIEFHKKKLAKELNQEGDGMLILESGAKVAGFIWMAVKKNYITNEPYVNFKSLYFVEEFRGTRGPELLLKAGMDYCRARKARKITGKLHVENLAMRALYKQFGFKPTHLTMEFNV
jgi:RimJ/RimL family protein N-acetyltransferase